MTEDSPGRRIYENILAWIREGVLSADWQILYNEWFDAGGGVIEADAPGIPGKLVIQVVDEAVRMVVALDMETVDMLPHRKAALYRKFLKVSKLPLVKVYLEGEEHEPVVAVDIPTEALNRQLFELGLKALLASLLQLALEGLGRKLVELELKTLKELLENMKKSGIPKKDAYKRLVEAGLDKKLAKALVDEVFGKHDLGSLLIR